MLMPLEQSFKMLVTYLKFTTDEKKQGRSGSKQHTKRLKEDM